jgi:uncharacterized protein (TIGR02145 family)
MKENMDFGDRLVGTGTSTNNGVLEKHCPANVAANCSTKGGLYTWNEAMQYVTTAGAQGICPTGWHIPTDAEYYTLENYLTDAGQTCTNSRTVWGQCATAGNKLKQVGTTYWLPTNTGANNSSGFTAISAGIRFDYGPSFTNASSHSYLWTSTIYAGVQAWTRVLRYDHTDVYRGSYLRGFAYTIRCVQD